VIPTATCPSEGELAAFVEQKLGEPAAESMRDHLDGCESCRSGVLALVCGSREDGPRSNLARPRLSSEGDLPDLPAADPERYTLSGELARGGMGRVWRARDRRLGRQVAIKELLDGNGNARARFEREVRITARLQHPAIVNLLEAGTWPDGEPFIAMKLVAGEPLDRVIAGRQGLVDRLALLPNVIAVVDALAYAHGQQVIHRDLKPANVLVGAFGETVVIDWGLAKDLAEPEPIGAAVGPYRTPPGSAEGTLSGTVIGTPGYMPVEQARGGSVDARADVYALGAMLYHLLSGQPPYRGSSAAAVVEAVIKGPPPPLERLVSGAPRDLVTIVHKAMAREAADRYASAAELALELKKFQTGQLVGSHAWCSKPVARSIWSPSRGVPANRAPCAGSRASPRAGWPTSNGCAPACGRAA
jgi:serine/threonine protein kinase